MKESRIDRLIARADKLLAASQASDEGWLDEHKALIAHLNAKGVPVFAACMIAWRAIAADNRELAKPKAQEDTSRDDELLAIIRRAVGPGESLPTVTRLAELFKMPQRQVSAALKRLAAQGHVTKRRVGIYERWCRT